MWNAVQKIVRHPIVQFLKKLCGDPVQLYILLLMTTIMQYYHSAFTWLYTLAAVFLSWGMMRFYDFVAKHKYLGPLCYMVYFAVGMFMVSMLTEIGRTYYPIGFLVWFLTPQSVVDFSIWYTLAIYLLMLGFLSSAVYYFSKTRYRMVMQFLLMLIPLSLYAKEGVQAPALLVILTLTSYFLLMVWCRQLRESSDVRRISNVQTGTSVTVYVLVFSILAAVIPKPAVRADREFIENSMAMSSWSDVLMAAISMFTDTASSGGVNTIGEGRTVYYTKCMEPLRLRTQTFSYYTMEDTWQVDEAYDYPDRPYEELFVYAPDELLGAIQKAAVLDADFAAAYGLDAVQDVSIPDLKERELILITNLLSSKLMALPTRTAGIGTYESNTLVSAQGTITPEGFSYERGLVFPVTYYTDVYANEPAVRELLSCMRGETYAAMLSDAVTLLAWDDPEASALLEGCLAEYEQALRFHEDVIADDYQSDAVAALAEEITAGLTSDFEKAKAIEQYFLANDFVYDDRYEKPSGANVDHFLLESHTGVCYEYATAMVLLCRAAGLPARYAQGYSMSDPYHETFETDEPPYQIETDFVIKVRHAHAFPEVYIAGYGWLSFEPTVPSEEAQNTAAENYYVMLWGFVILGLALIALAIYMLLPTIREKRFRSRLAAMPPREAASAAFIRMRDALHLADSTTVMALAEHAAPFSRDADFYMQLDALLYDEAECIVKTGAIAAAYVRWQEERAAFEKAEKKRLREEKKQKRKNRRNQS